MLKGMATNTNLAQRHYDLVTSHQLANSLKMFVTIQQLQMYLSQSCELLALIIQLNAPSYVTIRVVAIGTLVKRYSPTAQTGEVRLVVCR